MSDDVKKDETADVEAKEIETTDAVEETTDAGEALLAESRERKDAWLAARLALVDEAQRDRLAAAVEVLDELIRAEEPPS